MDNVKVADDYKDRLFRMIFNDKEKLLELYNAMNRSDYTDASELQVVTLENAIYLSMKNDVAYVLHDELFLYEQQSTKNANMPLRCLFYASDTYSVLVKDKNLYGTKMLPLPSPTFVVFYNGKQKMDEEGELRLSDAFVKKTGDSESGSDRKSEKYQYGKQPGTFRKMQTDAGLYDLCG